MKTDHSNDTNHRCIIAFFSIFSRQTQLRPQFSQPLSAELLTQQQNMIKQLQQHQQQQQLQQQCVVMNNSPKRTDLAPNHRQMLSQTIIHQSSYGVAGPPPQTQQIQQNPAHHILAQYQQASIASNLQQQLQSTATQLRQLSSSSVIPSSQSPVAGSGRSLPTPVQCLQMSYYSQNAAASQQPPYFGEVVHSLQVSKTFNSNFI